MPKRAYPEWTPPNRTRVYVSVEAPDGGHLIIDGPLALLTELIAALRSGSGSIDAPFCSGRLSGALRAEGGEREGEGA
jgi:hypothetical protein